MELASGRRRVTCKAWPWESLKENSQLQLTLWPSHWAPLTLVFCIALPGDLGGYSVSSVTVSTTGFWNLDLACQIHLIHWKLELNSAGIHIPLSQLLPSSVVYVYALAQRDSTPPMLKTFMYILNFTNPSSSIETMSIILLSTCRHAVKIKSWKFTAVDRLQ